MCGLKLELDGDRIVSVRGDEDDPFSQGYICPKGVAIGDVHHDPDRLRAPLRRAADGSFAPIGWDEAFDLVEQRLHAVRARDGADAIAVYMGNPIIHNYGVLLLRASFARAVGSRNFFGAGSQDTSPPLGCILLSLRLLARHARARYRPNAVFPLRRRQSLDLEWQLDDGARRSPATACHTPTGRPHRRGRSAAYRNGARGR
jgi:hypothetical protein